MIITTAIMAYGGDDVGVVVTGTVVVGKVVGCVVGAVVEAVVLFWVIVNTHITGL